jgi:hypothetical protein
MKPENGGLMSAVSDTIARATDLIQLEFRLFRAELKEKGEQMAGGLALMLSAAVLLTAALFLLLQAAVIGLVEAGLSPLGATLVVAGIVIAIGTAMMASARKQLSPETLVPDRTFTDLKRDGAIVKEKLS